MQIKDILAKIGKGETLNDTIRMVANYADIVRPPDAA